MRLVPFEPSAVGHPESTGQGELELDTLGSGTAGDPSTWPLLRAMPDAQAPAPGTSLGPYRLLRVLGRGGMGVVYLAHEAPPIQRLVAVKILRSSNGSRRLRKRLETEVRALARLSHPSIAQVFAAGHTADGSPYFALEYVPGLRIDEYCNQERLTLEERLELFLQLCGGVRYAHQRGVLHRDLKPSNVLVTEIEGRPLVKIIDFSIAASLVPSDADSATSGVAGTPGYMSPEARRNETSTADQRADVYSLGVVLYQLLSGLRPFAREVGTPDPQDARKAPREVPPAPSERVGALPLVARENLAEKRRQTKPRELSRRLRGDLDAIVLRAMDPARSRRYGSVQELVDDIRRHRSSDAVRARPLTWAYRSACFARRNRRTLAATLGLVLALGAATGFTSLLSGTREEARDWRAELMAERKASEFLRDLATADGLKEIGPVTSTLENARRRADRLEDQPILQARVFQLLARAHHDRHLYSEATDLLERALQIQTTQLGADSVAVADTTTDLCRLYGDRGRYARAVELCESSLALRTRRLGDDHPEVAESLGLLAYATERDGRVARAFELHERTVSLRRRHQGEDPEALADALDEQAGFHRRQGELDAARRLLEDSLRLRIQLAGAEDPAIAIRREALADVYALQGKLEKARLEYVHGLQVLERADAGHEIHKARILTRLGRLDLAVGRTREAELNGRRALGLLEGKLASDHPALAETRVLLSRVLTRSGDLPAAATLAEQALAAYRTAFGSHHPDTAWAELAAGDVAAARGDLPAARRAYETALPALRQFRPDSAETAGAMSRLGRILLREGYPAEARGLQQEALSVLEGLPGLPQLEAAAVLRELARIARDTGDVPEATRFLERALTLRLAFVGSADPEVRSLRAELAGLAHSSTSWRGQTAMTPSGASRSPSR